MSDRPILFSTPMVLALLAGTKTQTRRIIKPQPIGYPWFWEGDEVDPKPGWFDGYETGRAPCGAAIHEVNDPIKVYAKGDRLWVRESHAIVPRTAYRMSTGVQQTICPSDPDMAAVYAAGWERSRPGQWKPSIHMPRWASRITLLVDDVKVERLQDISEEDAKAEGVSDEFTDYELYGQSKPYKFGYSSLWNLINGEGAWDHNDWVVAYTFRVIRENIDYIGRAA